LAASTVPRIYTVVRTAQRDDLDGLGSEFHLLVTETPTAAMSHTLPNREQIEAAITRIRPLMMPGEPIYYDKFTGALGWLVRSGGAHDRERIARLRGAWQELPSRARWYMDVLNPDTGKHSTLLSDREIAAAWLYGELLHAETSRQQEIVHLPEAQRLFAALALVRDAIVITRNTVRMIDDLQAHGVIDLGDARSS